MTTSDDIAGVDDWAEPRRQRLGVRFPWDALSPHEHSFSSAADIRAYNRTMCRCCGLRLLHLWLNSRDWVRRRTEAVSFIDDRTVRRQVTVDFIKPGYAPSLTSERRTLDILPVALLQKKSLVKFDLRDHAGAALSLLGLRQQQTLTAAALKGVAASIGDRDPREELDPRVEDLIERLVFGERHEVHQAMERLRTAPEFVPHRRDHLFLMTCERLLDSWVMCLLLQREEVTRRIIKFGYDEPLDLHYEPGTTGIEPQPWLGEPTAYALRPARNKVRMAQVTSGLGLEPVRIRFPISAAESAQSYHLEVTAPPGALVRAGQALASPPTDPPPVEPYADGPTGDPGDPARPFAIPGRGPDATPPVSFDQVSGMHPTVDLHLTDVPTGVFSQAQVELRAQVGGWLLPMTIACWVNSLMLLVLTVTPWRSGDDTAETAVTLLIVFISFGSTVVARQEGHAMVGRLLSHVRNLAGLSSLAALVGAGIVALAQESDHWLWIPTIVSGISATVLTAAAWKSRSTGSTVTSPWDFTPLTRVDGDARRGLPQQAAVISNDRPPDDATARRRLGLDKPAIVVATAESVRHRSRWTPSVESHLRERLQGCLLRTERPVTEVDTTGTTSRTSEQS